MSCEEEKILDLGSYRKLREIEQTLKDEMAARNRELIEIMNKKDEYIAHLLRIVLAKVDSMDSRSKMLTASAESLDTTKNIGKKKKERRLFRVLNNSLADFVGL